MAVDSRRWPFGSRASTRRAPRHRKHRRPNGLSTWARKTQLVEVVRMPSTSRARRWLRLLQELVADGEPVEVERLLREAAEYIECLQVQVRVMQAMVKLLSESSDSRMGGELSYSYDFTAWGN
ncbi:hypothetical protein OPV22_028992 [Ensete ventricosum]|uniref:BHLH domain-containing protein n=1 Tax=Ensete ventricosum TaxID=4639 RepID=A0AAV8NZZ4_ENSVE|nr:hypothetical protein OPV22_034711 [Ensete ventricosum]KAJ8466440.1 hypothetical protein OPV22_028992 [Ensete ventricosum]